MTSLSQYTDLYKDNAAAIDAHSEPLINALRPEAFKALEDKRLPEKGDEGFKTLSVEEMFRPDFGLNIMRVNIPTDIAKSFRCDIPNVSTLLGIVVNDAFVPSDTLKANLPAGVDVMSLRKACREIPDVVSAYYGKIAPLDNPGVALNTLLAQDGVVIRLRRGVRLESPIQLVNIFNSPAPLMAVRRILIVAEDESAGSVFLCDHTQSDNVEFLSSEVIEIALGNNATLDIHSIEESTPHTRRYSQMFARQSTGAVLRSGVSTLRCGMTRNEFNVDILGEHCQTLLSGMAIADGNMHIDNKSSVNHLAPRSQSNQLFKYLLDEKAQGAFEGGIYVDPKAPFTEGYQNNRNILASPDARMHTEPQLLIYNDEVKCSHGTATGQLDANALFYMQARGIPFDEARRLLMIAFMTDTLETIKVEGIKSRLAMLVEKRLGGENAICGDCASSCHNIK